MLTTARQWNFGSGASPHDARNEDVAVFNIGDAPKTIDLKWAEVGSNLENPAVLDLWARKELKRVGETGEHPMFLFGPRRAQGFAAKPPVHIVLLQPKLNAGASFDADTRTNQSNCSLGRGSDMQLC